MPNKLSQFWQELKRRKVSRVITVYGAAAFVILELGSNIAEPLNLPEWFLPIVIVLLCIGFIIAVILSWIYDIHPEGGIVKTEPADEVKDEAMPKSSSGWKIASYISFVVIVGLIVLNIIPRANTKKEILEKSIAVLPLAYLSEDPNKEYLANGVLDAITGHLSMIEGLRVMPRTSVEQYRENKKPAKEIGEELGVSYLIEGSFQMIGDQVKLIIQLVDAAEGDHVFFREYDREYKDIFAVQSEVAKTIAREIEVIITPEEKEFIEKVPTTDLTAYDFVLRGEEEMMNLNIERAEELFNKALIYDSTYALAYAMLGAIYGIKSFTDHNRDTVLKFIDKALYYDDELPGAYILKGNYFQYSGRMDQAILAYEKAFKLKPNDYWTNFYIGYYYAETDYIKCIKAWQRAASLSSGSDRSQSLKNLGTAYSNAGFEDKALEYYSQVVSLDGDSSFYYRQKAFYEYGNSDIDQAIKYFRKAHVVDSTSNESIYDLLNLGWSLYTLGKYQESLYCWKSALEFAQKKKLETIIFQDYYHRLAQVYLKNGFSEEAEHYFNRAEESLPKSRELTHSLVAYYELAAFNALRGEKEQALEYLRILNQRKLIPFWRFGIIKLDELFDSIRDEPEFQQIVQDIEAKFQAEHERVRKWLEENDNL